MEKMSQSVLATGSEDMVTPFLSWRLYVAQQRLVRAKEKCSEAAPWARWKKHGGF